MNPPPERHRLRDNPWWIPPFLGSVPRGISEPQIRLLGFVCFAMFFENYDMSMLGNALPQIRATFGLDEQEAGTFLGLIRLGALPAFFLIPLADRRGRRWLLLASIVGMSIGSLLTSFSPSANWFVGLQVITRTFIIAASVTTFVIVAEEFPAEHRGWGIGILGSVGAMGFGLGAIIYGFVNSLPFGWRTLYAVGFAPVLLLPLFRRGITETRRFNAHREQQVAGDGGWRDALSVLRPIATLFAQHPRRAIAIAVLGAVATAGHAPAFQFVSDFLQQERGWSPGTFAAMTFFFGGLGIIGSVVAGRLGDRYGRRAVGFVVLVSFPLFAAAFYAGPPQLLIAPWVCMVFASMATTVILRALATEVFPTSARGTAGGGLALFETLGAAGGLFLVAALLDVIPDRLVVIPLIAGLTALSAGCLFLLPETRRRELESINEEQGARDVA